MATTAYTPRASQRSGLTLLHGRTPQAQASALAQATPIEDGHRAPLHLVGDQAHRQSILVAGSDERRRSSLLRQLSARLPEGTCIKEASATWEVLEHAPSSRMVMLAGGLDGSSAESVMHLLGNRHPQLPVLALGAG